MIWFWVLIIAAPFIAGFAVACLMAANGQTELRDENQELRRQLAMYHHPAGKGFGRRSAA